MSGAHSRFSPSGASRWLRCRASIEHVERLAESPRGEKLLLPDGSAFAAEGTRAHELAANAVRRLAGQEEFALEDDPALYDADMARYADEYADYVAEHVVSDSEVFVEERVALEAAPEVWGTADAIVVSPERVDVIDYKYGAGVPVSAENNEQLMIYGAAALASVPPWLLPDGDAVVLHVFQPRVAHGVSTMETTGADLLRWVDAEVVPAVADVKASEAYTAGRYSPSAKACRWCRAEPSCGALGDTALAAAAEDFAVAPDAAIRFDEARFLHHVSKLDMVERWTRAVRSLLAERVLSGDGVPGWKAVRGRGSRRWADEQAAERALRYRGLKRDDLYKPRKLISVAQAQKRLSREDFEKIAERNVVKVEGSLSVVAADHPKPAVSLEAEAAEGFDA